MRNNLGFLTSLAEFFGETAETSEQQLQNNLTYNNAETIPISNNETNKTLNNAETISTPNNETNKTLIKSFIFWRLPEAEPKYSNQISLEKLGRNVSRTFRNYAKQFPELSDKNFEEVAQQFCESFFLSDFNQDITAYLANLSLNDNSDRRISLSIRIPAHPIFNEHLSQNIAVAVIGYCPTSSNNPIFIPENVILTHGNIEPTNYESEVQAEFQMLDPQQFPPRNRQNLLKKEFTQSLPKYAVKTKERLSGWLDFLRFKNNLIKHKTQGLRYLDWQFNEELGQVKFWVIAENELALKKARSAFNRQSLYAFNINVSTEPFCFNLKQNSDRVESSFAGLGQVLAKNGIQKIDIKKDKKLVEQMQVVAASLLEDGKKTNNFDISQAVFATVSVEISEDLANKLSQITDEVDENKLNRQDKIEQAFKKLPHTGFLSISLVGDLALVKRHERAVKNLQQNEGCYAPYLSSYLFDIANANEPDELIDIAEWCNKELNDKQKSAVQKMLSAPDICLIQGPPGTGKTTVIAEACFQFARRGETVLLASQAHDALDNALSRLQDNPEVRAIRLAKSVNRITDEGKEFTGESVLAKHYQSLKRHITDEYLSPLDALNEKILKLREWKTNADFIASDLQNLRLEYQQKNNELQEAKHSLSIHQTEFDANMISFNQQAQAIDLLNTLLNVLVSKQQSQTLSSFQGKLPESLLPLTQKICQLESINIEQSFSYELLLADIDNQIAIFANLWSNWCRVRNHSEKMKIDLENMKNQSSGTLLDTETQLRIAELTQEIDDITQRLDDDDDNAELSALWTQKRRERKALKDKALAFGGLNLDIYKIFKDSANFTQNNNIEELKSLITNRLQKINSIDADINSLLVNIIPQLTSELNSYNAQKPSDEHIITQKKIINEIEIKLNTIVERGKAKNEQGKQWLINGGFEDNVDFIETINAQQENILNLNQQLIVMRSQNKDFLPLFECFEKILGNPAERAQLDWNELEKPFIESCNLVAITCNENERTLSENDFDGFDVVIIDEVSKATPLELLLPLMRGKKAVLVGDHRQLPPVFNEADGLTFEDEVENNAGDEDQEVSNTDLNEANLHKYEKMVTASLFKELFEQAPESLRERLNIQFRMHPDIMNMINFFYDKQLVCGNPEKERLHHITFKGLLSKQDHVLWIDTTDDEQGKRFKIDDGQGNINRLEARMIAQTLVEINRQLELEGYHKDNRMKVGVVSFYQPQCRVIREEIRKATGKTKGWFSALDVEINTVIRYQGKEKPIILLSLVKNNGGDLNQKFRIGRANIARFEFINVAMSRAQNLLLIFGARNMLENREVKLPRMDEKGFDKKLVYKNMFKFLEYQAESGNICLAQEFANVLPKVSSKLHSEG